MGTLHRLSTGLNWRNGGYWISPSPTLRHRRPGRAEAAAALATKPGVGPAADARQHTDSRRAILHHHRQPSQPLSKRPRRHDRREDRAGLRSPSTTRHLARPILRPSASRTEANGASGVGATCSSLLLHSSMRRDDSVSQTCRSHRRPKRYSVHTEPVHSTGKPFASHTRIEGTPPLYVDTWLNAAHIRRNARGLLAALWSEPRGCVLEGRAIAADETRRPGGITGPM